MRHKKIMIQGTGSSTGKSVIAAGLARIFYKDGNKVAPYKSQNMALNSYIDRDGLEMGRAQVVQAEACNTLPRAYMNPILMKPNSDNDSQIIIEGIPHKNMDAKEYFQNTNFFKSIALKNYKIIETNYDIGVLEGGGSPAEMNLRDVDLVNMGMAELIDSPVILVGDIERGGVFASLYGTILMLDETDRRRIKGLIINKFRGDMDLLLPGIEDLTNRLLKAGIDLPVLGVIPWVPLNIEEEDILTNKFGEKQKKNDLNIAVIRLDKMSNYTDFDALSYYKDLSLNFTLSKSEIEDADIIIIPGSKNTIQDLIKLKQLGIDRTIIEQGKKGKIIVGICGGYQILGQEILDPHMIESKDKIIKGLGLLDITTTMEKEKQTFQTTEKITHNTGLLKGCVDCTVSGYEIHQGVTRSKETSIFQNKPNLGVLKDNIFATYIHGVFDNSVFTRTFINNIRISKGLEPIDDYFDFKKFKIDEYDRWEETLRNSLDIDKIYEILGESSNEI
jgi:adenosylcobyric acid synthase